MNSAPVRWSQRRRNYGKLPFGLRGLIALIVSAMQPLLTPHGNRQGA
jgi:hypothetical protein